MVCYVQMHNQLLEWNIKYIIIETVTECCREERSCYMSHRHIIFSKTYHESHIYINTFYLKVYRKYVEIKQRTLK